MKILDTCFLIHLHREWVKRQPGTATEYLKRNGEAEFFLSVITQLEFLEGYDEVVEGQKFLSPFAMIPVSTEIARIGSRIRRDLRKRGEMIGDFDILIAATAMESGGTIVTDNVRHFERVEGLKVETYR